MEPARLTIPVHECGSCGATIASSLPACPYCGVVQNDRILLTPEQTARLREYFSGVESEMQSGSHRVILASLASLYLLVPAAILSILVHHAFRSTPFTISTALCLLGLAWIPVSLRHEVYRWSNVHDRRLWRKRYRRRTLEFLRNQGIPESYLTEGLLRHLMEKEYRGHQSVCEALFDG